jgi:hypothetical protein
MKIVAIIITVFGALMVLSGINLMFTKYNLNDPHDLSKSLGSLAVSGLILAGGATMWKKSNKKSEK